MKINNKKIVLVIIDGWGVSLPNELNPINPKNCPFYHGLAKSFPTTTLYSTCQESLNYKSLNTCSASYFALGTSNFEYDDINRIDKAIAEKVFSEDNIIKEMILYCKNYSKPLHLIGQLSEGKKNSSLNHLKSLLLILKKNKISNIYIHGILDGIDTPPMSGKKYIKEIVDFIQKESVGKLATLTGRYFAMDRSGNYNRTEKFYRVLTTNEGKLTNNPISYLEECYEKKIYEEEVKPLVVNQQKIQDGDGVIFFNTRSDRSRQILQAFLEPDFKEFKIQNFVNLKIAFFSRYKNNLNQVCPQSNTQVSFIDCLSEAGLKFISLSSPAKLACNNFFLNGKKQLFLESKPNFKNQNIFLDNENENDKLLVEIFIKTVAKKDQDFIILSLSSPDEAAHHGLLSESEQVARSIDKLLSRIYKYSNKHSYDMLICSDHGSFEDSKNYIGDKSVVTHSENLVPFIIVDKKLEGKLLNFEEVPGDDLSLIKPAGSIIDIAPTILKILNLNIPKQMKGKSLV
jgi:2,3-bisphosphoglycerate-independent phosphoglycerate mutase